MAGRGIGAAVATLGAVIAVAGVATAATGDHSFRDCISGNTVTAPGACEQLPEAAVAGVGSGLQTIEEVAVSPDGRSVYAVANTDDSLSWFKRDTRTGAIEFKRCITGNSAAGSTGTAACDDLPEAGTNGAASGLDGPTSVGVSRDGESIYVAAENDDAISTFERTRSGKPVFNSCLTARDLVDDPCAELPGATGIGSDTGMDSPQRLALSEDSRSLYVVAQQDDSVVRFKRSLATGALAFKGCLSGDLDLGPDGSDRCDLIGTVPAGGSDTGMNAVDEVVVSSDGRSVYTVASADTAIARFNRADPSGALTYRGCLTGETDTGGIGSGACDEIPGASAEGANSGMDETSTLAVSPDGGAVYLGSQTDAAVTVLDRRRSGRISYGGCLAGEQASAGNCDTIPSVVATNGGQDSGLAAISDLAFAGNSHLYAPTQSDHGVAHFRRDRESGDLTYVGCVTGETASGPDGSEACEAIGSVALAGAGSGLDNLVSAAAAPDRRSLYVGSHDDDAVARFKLAK